MCNVSKEEIIGVVMAMFVNYKNFNEGEYPTREEVTKFLEWFNDYDLNSYYPWSLYVTKIKTE